MSINKVILVGNVGQDPEIKQTSDGRYIASFSVATSEKWKAQDGSQKEKTEWHKVVVFNQALCQVIQKGMADNWIRKGSKVYIEGQLQTRKWTDNNGVEKYITEVILQNFNSSLQILDSRNNANNTEATNYNQNQAANTQESYQKLNTNQQASNQNFNEELADDDIPF